MKTRCVVRSPLASIVAAVPLALATCALFSAPAVAQPPAGQERMPDPTNNLLDILGDPGKTPDAPANTPATPADPNAAPPAAPSNSVFPGVGYATGGNEQAQQAVIGAYQAGMQLQAETKYSAAIEKFNEALSIDPRFAPALFEQGNAFSALGEYDLALQALTKATLYARQYPEIFNARGEVYLKINRLRDAVADFNQAVALRPTDPQFMYNRGSTYVKLGSQARALGDLEDAAQNFQSGISALDRAIGFDPQLVEAYADRSLARAELGQIEMALTDIEKSVSLAPESVEYQQRLGYAYLQYANQQSLLNTVSDEEVAGYFAKAIDAFTKVLELLNQQPATGAGNDDLSTSLPTALAPSADTAGPGGDLTEAKQEDMYVARAVAHLRIARHVPPQDQPEHFQAALADCNASLAIEPRQPAALFNRGLAYRYQDDLRGAVKSFTQALDIAPDYVDARLRRGIAWFYLNEYEMALSDFLRAAEAGGDPRPLFWAGVLTARRGDYARAVRLYTDALRGNRQYAIAYTNRGLAYMHLEQYERAIDDFNELIRLDQRDAASYYRRAVAYERLKRYDQAIESYRQALEWNPDLPGANEALGNLYQELGETERAQQYLNRGNTDSRNPRERTARRAR